MGKQDCGINRDKGQKAEDSSTQEGEEGRGPTVTGHRAAGAPSSLDGWREAGMRASTTEAASLSERTPWKARESFLAAGRMRGSPSRPSTRLPRLFPTLGREAQTSSLTFHRGIQRPRLKTRNRNQEQRRSLRITLPVSGCLAAAGQRTLRLGR